MCPAGACPRCAGRWRARASPAACKALVATSRCWPRCRAPEARQVRKSGTIDYVELPAGDLATLKPFYREAFGWTFTDYGPSYASFAGAGVDGGFDADASQAPNKPLVVIWADDLEAMQAKVIAAGGRIVRPIFSFPGGRRFHFQDPSGNELAAWSS